MIVGFFQKIFKRDWKSFKQRGDSYHSKQEWGLARGEYLEALKRLEASPDNSPASAQTINDKLLQVTSALLKHNVTKAETFHKTGNLEQAITQYNFAMKFATSDEKIELLKQISIIEDKGRIVPKITSAPTETHAVLEIDRQVSSDDNEVFNVLITSLDPIQASVYEGLGENFRSGYLALMNQDLEVAEAMFRPLYERDPGNRFIQYELGRVLFAQGNTDSAEELLRDAANNLPDFIPVRHAWIEALWEKGDLSTAERVVEEAFEIDDLLFENYTYAARTCLRSGEFENGVEIIEAGLSVHENSIELNRMLGELERGNGNFQAAIAAFETVLGLLWQYDYKTEMLKFDHISAYAAAGLYLQTGINLERAAELYRALIACGPPANNWMFVLGLGQVYAKQGSAAQARELFLSVLAELPEDSTSREPVQKLIAMLDGDPESPQDDSTPSS